MLVITPTRNRPQCFALLETYLSRQTIPFTWLVINDGSEPYTYTQGQKVYQRDPSKDKGHSLCHNLSKALAVCGFPKKVAICEDDDWYHPTYLARLSEALDEAELVGFNPALYYNLMYSEYRDMGNEEHASLAATGFRAAVLPTVRTLCKAGDPYIDLALWEGWKGSKALYPNHRWHVGLGSLWGEPGIGWKHKPGMGRRAPRGLLESWIGDDAKNYLDD